MANRRKKYPEEFATQGRLKKLYQVWQDMNTRCDPNSRHAERYRARYFGRGITLHEDWAWWPTFAAWAIAAGWQPGLEIDRRDNDGSYTPENCRFVTKTVQNRNRDMGLVARSIKAAHTARLGKPFKCIETGEEFMTQIEAQRRTGVCRKGIRHALIGKYSQAGGFHWQYITAEAPMGNASVNGHR